MVKFLSIFTWAVATSQLGMHQYGRTGYPVTQSGTGTGASLISTHFHPSLEKHSSFLDSRYRQLTQPLLEKRSILLRNHLTSIYLH